MSPLEGRRWTGALRKHAGLGTLEALAWGELERGRARRVLGHLSRCARCRDRWGWVRRTLPALLERVTPGLPSSDPSAVLARRARGERVLLPVARAPGRSRSRRGVPARGPGASS